MSSQLTNLDKHLKLIESLPQASPSDEFEDRLFSRLEEEETTIKLPAASRWINWSVAALIALAITNVFVLTQQSTGAEEIDMLLVETVDQEYYYGQELLAIDEP